MTAIDEAGARELGLSFRTLPSSTDLFPGLARLGGDLRFGRIESGPIPADSPERLREAASAAYAALLDRISEESLSLLRIWNRIPHIGRRAGGGLDMYMVFGEGRFEAFAEHYGTGFDPAAHLPASTGVGAAGDRLTVDFAAAEGPVRQVRNSRQVDAWDYSARYGPRPPCFARGTIREGNGETLFLLAGTASILGEATVHEGDLAGQIDQTIDNLRWLVGRENLAAQGIDRGFELPEIDDLVVYHPRAGDRKAIEARLASLFPAATRRLFVRTGLCRPDMLVEIEGLVRA